MSWHDQEPIAPTTQPTVAAWLRDLLVMVVGTLVIILPFVALVALALLVWGR